VRGRWRAARFVTAAGCCGALASAGLRCDVYEGTPPASDPYAWRSNEPQVPASTPTRPPPKARSSSAPLTGGDGGQKADGAESDIAVPAAAPPYLPATYEASLECPGPRTVRVPAARAVLPQFDEEPDPDGTLGTFQPGGPTTTSENAFFQALGTNGRACATCHEPASGMSVSVDRIQLRFERTLGADPIFDPVDGADCPSAVQPAATSAAVVGGRTGHGTTEARASHSLLLTKGLIRIFLPVPDGADYTVTVERDPVHCNTDPAFNRSTDPRTGAVHQVLSVYRRPRPTANLSFIASPTSEGDAGPGAPVQGGGEIMWDGREPSLESQAVDATLIHGQAIKSPTEAQVAQIVAFQRGIFAAQIFSNSAHGLADLGGLGGPRLLATFGDTGGAGAGARPLPLYDAWRSLAPDADNRDQRMAVLRGQTIFESRTFSITAVAGLNDAPAVDRTISNGTCATCHSRPGVGSSRFAGAQLDIGIGGGDAALGGPAPSSELPVFKIVCKPGANTGFHSSTVLTNDPGKALVSGKCADVGRFTVAPLRGLSARAPYFSDGSAPLLTDVVEFYDKRFSIGLSATEKDDLVQFLRTL
jgi:cytochrome c peroxidase